MSVDKKKSIITLIASNLQTVIASSLPPLIAAIALGWQGSIFGVQIALIVLLAVVIIFIAVLAVPWAMERRSTSRKITNDSLDVFRFEPYRSDEIDVFYRPDAIQEKMTAWIRFTEEPFLYMTGASGAGKTSLLQAWLIPKFSEIRPGSEIWTFDNLEYLEDYAKRKVGSSRAFNMNSLYSFIQTKIDELYPDRSNSEDINNLRDLLEEATRYVDGRIFVAIDQFGSSMLIRDEEERDKIAIFFNDIIDRPIARVSFLLVMRSDRFDLDNLSLFNLPPPTSPGNRLEVSALQDHESLALLEKLAPGLSQNQRTRILNEAKEIDEGVVRPVTLNIAGKALRSVGESPSKGALIESYLLDLISKPGYDDFVPRLLQHMMSKQGRIRHITVEKLADRLSTNTDTVLSFLRTLAQDGVVRSLDKPANRTWEITHSFLAEQLHGMLGGISSKGVRNTKRNLLYATVASMAALAITLIVSYSVTKEIRELQRHGIEVFRSNGSYAVLIDTDQDVHLVDKLTNKFDFVNSMEITHTDQIETIDLQVFPNLTELKIDNNDRLKIIVGLSDLIELRRLTITRNARIEDLASISSLSNLESLLVEFNPSLKELPSLDKMSSTLATLKVRRNDSLGKIPDLGPNRELSNLWIMNNQNLDSIPPLGDLSRYDEIALIKVNSRQNMDEWFEQSLNALKGVSNETTVFISREARRRDWDKKINQIRVESNLKEIQIEDW